jgi:hypothetical protein
MLDTLKCPRCDHLAQFCECGEYHNGRSLSAKQVREMFAACDRAHESDRQPATDLRRCDNCGRIGREGVDVSTTWHHLGGVGDVLRTYCREMVLCWTRQERTAGEPR